MSTVKPIPVTGIKRSFEEEEPVPAAEGTSARNTFDAIQTVTSVFRNVSACSRCRVRKNRCDQQLPACAPCAKAGVRCVGYDPITKRELPRSYVYFLETRLSYFEGLLKQHDILYDTAKVFDADSGHLGDPSGKSAANTVSSPVQSQSSPRQELDEQQGAEDDKIDNLVSNIGMVSVYGTSDQRYLGSTSGISFARVVLSAVKISKKGRNRNSSTKAKTHESSGKIRDTYFGLQARPEYKPAALPSRSLSEQLVSLYFEHANPQIPILHRKEFEEMLAGMYDKPAEQHTARELYFLNIVLAIGAGIIWRLPDDTLNDHESMFKRARLDERQAEPEEYHASAVVHLGSILGTSSGSMKMSSPGDNLEELQAVLLMAGFALLRPIAPGLWYIVGVAMRLAVDLGLHYEDSLETADESDGHKSRQAGRRQYLQDMRRRLWWCTYTFDRLVSTCVGRPFGITDQVVTTEFPSILEDDYITKIGFSKGVETEEVSYKRVSHHYFRLRLLQSEILQVLQYQQAQLARSKGWNRRNVHIHKHLQSPFLIKHRSFRAWRKDVDQRLYEWKQSAPLQHEIGVAFAPDFLELNYWQLVIILYRQSIPVPTVFSAELGPTDDVTSPGSVLKEVREDEDLVYMKCAEAGQKTLRLYRQLHRRRLINYTYLATHHLFMAGIAFLYAVWHSPTVRSRLSMDDFDLTVLAATSVLADLREKCPPAQACQAAFERMSRATLQMCLSDRRFGLGREPFQASLFPTPTSEPVNQSAPQPQQQDERMAPKSLQRPVPRFDMDLRDLFPDGKISSAHLPIPRRRAGSIQSRRSTPGISIRQITNQNITPLELNLDAEEVTKANPAGCQQVTQAFSAGPTMQNRHGYHYHHEENPYDADFVSELSDIEVLDRLPSTTNHHTSQPQYPGLQTDSNMDHSQTSAGASNAIRDVPLDLDWNSMPSIGSDMDLDFALQHDWNDPQGNFDLLDGFFFGDEDASI